MNPINGRIKIIDSRAKGRTGELNCRDELRKLTGLAWERTPMSGALNPIHMMKGDIYVPQVNIKFCVEVKFYKDDHISTKLLTTKSIFYEWWAQTVREAVQMNKKPLLVFKHNRSKWFAAHCDLDVYFATQQDECKVITIEPPGLFICLLTDFCKYNTGWVV